jgi:hypothetical protein
MRLEELHSQLRSITTVATKVHVTLRSFLVLTWMCDAMELVWHVTLGITQRRCEGNLNSFSYRLRLCGSLHPAFLGDVANTRPNIQQVAEEEEDAPRVDTWRNVRVWVDFLGGLH